MEHMRWEYPIHYDGQAYYFQLQGLDRAGSPRVQISTTPFFKRTKPQRWTSGLRDDAAQEDYVLLYQGRRFCFTQTFVLGGNSWKPGVWAEDRFGDEYEEGPAPTGQDPARPHKLVSPSMRRRLEHLRGEVMEQVLLVVPNLDQWCHYHDNWKRILDIEAAMDERARLNNGDGERVRYLREAKPPGSHHFTATTLAKMREGL